mgnify:CR=1 FL=1
MDRRAAEDGFTLLELVIALLVLSVAIGGLVGVLDLAFKTTAVDIHRVDATALATRELDRLRGGTPPASGPATAVLGNQSFSVTDDESPTSSGGGIAATYDALAVVVAWTDAAGPHRVEMDSATATPDPPPTTVVGCPAPSVTAPPTVGSRSSGDAAVDVSWTEPPVSSSIVPILRWAVEVSADGTTWTVGAPDEPALAVGTTHVLELGGLAPGDTYAARLLAYGACGAPGTSAAAVAGSPTAAVAGGPCTLGSVSLDTPVAPRAVSPAVPGSLAHDVTVVATTAGGCPAGLWAGVATSGTATVAIPLSAGPAGWFGGSIPGTTEAWDLGGPSFAADPRVASAPGGRWQVSSAHDAPVGG